MFDEIRDEATRNFRDLKLWVQNIDDTTPYSSTTRGLFYVYAYGLYEEIVRNVVIKTINELNASQVKVSECTFELYSLIFSNEYDSLYNVGNDNKWPKRWNISNKLTADGSINIPSELFPTDGKNIRILQLQSLANSFGIKSDILPRPAVGGYIQELVNNRNDIAHGNKLPKEVGGRYTKSELADRCEYIAEVCEHTINIYEKYITERQYLKVSST